MPRQKTNFKQMSLDQLVGMREQIQQTLDKKVAEERAELQMRLEALAGFRAEGGTLAVGRKLGMAKKANSSMQRGHSLKGRKVAIKYRGPNGETWTGRGLAPRWLTALESKGKKRDKYLV